MWDFWIHKYVHTHCLAVGMRGTTMIAYEGELYLFAQFSAKRRRKETPKEIKMQDIYKYIEYLRDDRNCKNWAVKRTVCVLKGFFKFMVADGHMDSDSLPVYSFPKVKSGSRTVKDTLSKKEIKKILRAIPESTVIGVRDKAIFYLLYSTGIRASECENLLVKDVDIEGASIKVSGKGGHERTIPLVKESVRLLKRYLKVRGEAKPHQPFFKSRLRSKLSRKSIYTRIKKYIRECHIHKRISPHNLRHTFARHAVEAGMNIVCLRDLLGHRSITSTQHYISINLSDLRKAVDLSHPVKDILTSVLDYLPDNVRMNFQRPSG